MLMPILRLLTLIKLNVRIYCKKLSACPSSVRGISLDQPARVKIKAWLLQKK